MNLSLLKNFLNAQIAQGEEARVLQGACRQVCGNDDEPFKEHCTRASAGLAMGNSSARVRPVAARSDKLRRYQARQDEAVLTCTFPKSSERHRGSANTSFFGCGYVPRHKWSGGAIPEQLQ